VTRCGAGFAHAVLPSPRSTFCTHRVQDSTQPMPRGTSAFCVSFSDSCTSEPPCRGRPSCSSGNDAGVAVDQHDAVGALERGTGRAHVHARGSGSAGTSSADWFPSASMDPAVQACGSTAAPAWHACFPPPGSSRFQCCMQSRNHCNRSHIGLHRPACPSARRCWPPGLRTAMRHFDQHDPGAIARPAAVAAAARQNGDDRAIQVPGQTLISVRSLGNPSHLFCTDLACRLGSKLVGVMRCFGIQRMHRSRA